jgi:IclR family transcriptional regulator, acetate operon repressor
MDIFLNYVFIFCAIPFFSVLSDVYIFHMLNVFFITGKIIMTPTDRGTRKARGRPRDWYPDADQNIIKSLDRAMDVFAYLSQAQGKTLSAIAAEMDQSPATIYRILVTLESKGLVEFDGEEQLWHIGSGAFVIGARFLRRTSLVERARPIMRRLMEATGETANLGIEREGAVLFVSQVETHASIRAFFPPGTLSPMHASGIGKALLAQMQPDRLDKWLAEDVLQTFTASTITNASSLKASLQQVRLQGFAVDDEERNAGMRCIAAPVFDMNREAVAGISVSGPTSRVGIQDVARLSRPVMDAAQQLTLAIGGLPAQPFGA